MLILECITIKIFVSSIHFLRAHLVLFIFRGDRLVLDTRRDSFVKGCIIIRVHDPSFEILHSRPVSI